MTTDKTSPAHGELIKKMTSGLQGFAGGVLFAVDDDAFCLVKGFGELDEIQAERLAAKMSMMVDDLRRKKTNMPKT